MYIALLIKESLYMAGWVRTCKTKRSRFSLVIRFYFKDYQASSVWSHAALSTEEGDNIQQAC